MAVYRQVHISFWQDPFIMELTPEEKYFYLYLMTNSKTKQCGAYELSKKVIMFETGYNQETVEKLMDRFISYGKIEYDDDTNEVMLVNWLKYNISKSPKLISCIKQEMLDLKSKRFFEHIKSHLDGHGEGEIELYRMANKAEISKNLAMRIFERDDFKCKRCNSTEDLTIDHIFPRSFGGSNAPSNLRVLCRSCNSARPTTGQKLLDDLQIDGYDFSDFDKLSGSVDTVSKMLGEEEEKEKEKEKKQKKQFAPAVSMYQDEYEKLIEKFGEADTNDRIERLSLYKKSKGKHYKCDYSTILSWARKEERDKPKSEYRDLTNAYKE